MLLETLVFSLFILQMNSYISPLHILSPLLEILSGGWGSLLDKSMKWKEKEDGEKWCETQPSLATSMSRADKWLWPSVLPFLEQASRVLKSHCRQMPWHALKRLCHLMGAGALSHIFQDAGMACAVCDSDGKGSWALEILTQVPSFQKAESGFRPRWDVRVPNFFETLF